MELVEEHCGRGIHDPEVAEIVSDESKAVPRYALVTAEDAYPDNGNLSLHETITDLQEQASGEMNEEYAWTPQAIMDLETGHELDYELKAEITGY